MKSHVAVLVLVGLLSSARAQLDADQASCAPLSYVLQIQPDSSSEMQVRATLNGATPLKVDSAKSTTTVKANVTKQVKPTGNVLNIQWKVTGDANKADARTSWVTLQMGSGQKYTPVAVFRTDYYPGRTSLNFKFDAPPAGNVRCVLNLPRYEVSLGRSSGGGRVTQFTLSINGKFYAITSNEPSDIGHGLHLDLGPYLKHGKNDVKLAWQVLKQQNTSEATGAQITRTANGGTQVLAQTVVKGKQGETGQLAVSITLP